MPRLKSKNRYLNLLATRASVPPNVPALTQPLLLSTAADLGTRHALVVTVVPLSDTVSDLNSGVTGGASLFVLFPVGLPRKRLVQAEVEKLEGSLGALARRDITFDEWLGG